MPDGVVCMEVEHIRVVSDATGEDAVTEAGPPAAEGAREHRHVAPRCLEPQVGRLLDAGVLVAELVEEADVRLVPRLPRPHPPCPVIGRRFAEAVHVSKVVGVARLLARSRPPGRIVEDLVRPHAGARQLARHGVVLPPVESLLVWLDLAPRQALTHPRHADPARHLRHGLPLPWPTQPRRRAVDRQWPMLRASRWAICENHEGCPAGLLARPPHQAVVAAGQSRQHQVTRRRLPGPGLSPVVVECPQTRSRPGRHHAEANRFAGQEHLAWGRAA